MVHLTDKDALVKEIEKRKKEAESNCGGYKSYDEHRCDACIVGFYEEFLEILNTLEVKEVKEEPVSNDLEEAIGKSFIYHENRGDDFRSDKQIETAYRYGFEDGFKYKESTSIIEDIEKQNLETKEADLEKEFYDFLDTLTGKDNGHLSENELFRIAEYFYELGLNTHKEE